MKNQYLDLKPSRKMFRISKHGLDMIRKRLDRIRAEQSEIYTHFKKKYNRHQLDDIVTEDEMQDLQQEMREIDTISDALQHIDIGRNRKFSF